MEKLHANNNLLRLDLVQAHLERIVLSAEMRRSKKLCQFLRFTVEEVLKGHGSELKEYAIGVGVFRRGREFDTGADPIVRVQARRLRSKLQQYYQAEGRDEPVRIEYPVGSYSPVFVQPTPQPAPAQFPGPPIQVRIGTAPMLIAVLPFIGVGAEGSETFSEGLTDELIHALSSCDGIRVIARSSAFQFKGRPEDVRRIGESLGVRALVSGSVRIEGSHLRVLAQLIDAGTGMNLQSSAYDRDLGGVLAIQQEISHEMAVILHAQIADFVSRDAPGNQT
jgi:serine/threonine-protein kinase